MEIIYEQIFRVLLAVFLSGVIGLERERHRKPAGLRTHMMVGIGAVLFTVVASSQIEVGYERVISGIVTGIGFIGAGNIIAQGKQGVHGLTTAASLWAVAAVGVAAGLGLYALSVATTIIILLVLYLGKIEYKVRKSK